MSFLFLIRGLPGSGKSTLARALSEKFGIAHVESDQYFMVDGHYVFDRTLLPQAHLWCQNVTKKSLNEGTSVAVSNTFVKAWEVLPYRRIAEETRARLAIITATGNYGNVHAVPEDVIQRMREGWEHVV